MKLITSVLALALVFSFCFKAYSQEALTQEPIKPDNAYNPKSENMAFYLSLIPTIALTGVGVGLSIDDTSARWAALSIAATGMAFGPSTGYVYGGLTWRGLGRGLLRTLIMGAGVGIGLATSHWSSLFTLSMIGGVAASIHGLYDIAVIKKHIRKRNEEVKNKMSLMFSPLYLARNESKTYGLQVNLVF